MDLHIEWSTLGWVALVLWWLVLPGIAAVLSRAVTPAAPHRSRRPEPDPTPGRLSLATEPAREAAWRWIGRVLWAAGALLGGRWRRLALRWSGRFTRRAALLELRMRRRENARVARAAQDERWARTLASSISSPGSRPMSTPMAPAEDEHTARWSPPGRRYPFAPSAPTPYRRQATVEPKYPPKARQTMRPPPPLTSLPMGPRKSNG